MGRDVGGLCLGGCYLVDLSGVGVVTPLDTHKWQAGEVIQVGHALKYHFLKGGESPFNVFYYLMCDDLL